MLTIFMAFITYKSNIISKDSVGIAQGALTEAQRANDLSEKNDSISSLSLAFADSVSRENLALTKESVTKQIEALNESQKQFEKTNIPFLQLRDLQVVALEEKKPIKIKYVLQNLGNYPARIIDTEIGYFVDTNIVSDNPYSNHSKPEHDTSENYIIKESPFNQIFTADSAINVFSYVNLTSANNFVYFFGDITYINEVNNKKRKCSFYIKISPPPSTVYKIIYIKNKDVD